MFKIYQFNYIDLLEWDSFISRPNAFIAIPTSVSYDYFYIAVYDFRTNVYTCIPMTFCGLFTARLIRLIESIIVLKYKIYKFLLKKGVMYRRTGEVLTWRNLKLYRRLVSLRLKDRFVKVCLEMLKFVKNCQTKKEDKS